MENFLNFMICIASNFVNFSPKGSFSNILGKYLESIIIAVVNVNNIKQMKKQGK